MAKEKLSADEKFEKVEFDLFDALAAIDRKDYSYYDRLTPEQQKKFVKALIIMPIDICSMRTYKSILSYNG